MRTRQRSGDDAGERSRLVEPMTTSDRNEDVNPTRAARLREALEAGEVEDLLDELRHLDHLGETHVV